MANFLHCFLHYFSFAKRHFQWNFDWISIEMLINHALKISYNLELATRWEALSINQSLGLLIHLSVRQSVCWSVMIKSKSAIPIQSAFPRLHVFECVKGCGRGMFAPAHSSVIILFRNKWGRVTILLQMGGQGYPTPIHTPTHPHTQTNSKRI